MVETEARNAAGHDNIARAIVLGASNVANGANTIFRVLRAHYDRPVEWLAAHGHGRSYGVETSILGRRLPGILECGLWDAIANGSQRPTDVLITDIGNDLIYGFPVEAVLEWVKECLNRFDALGATIHVTQLPHVNFHRISERLYRTMRAVFFPSCAVEREELLERAARLADLLERELQQREIRMIEPRAAWYGWDPIHIRRTQKLVAWQEILWFRDAKSSTTKKIPSSVSTWRRVQFAPPQERVLWGRRRHHEQPSVRFSDGSNVSFF